MKPIVDDDPTDDRLVLLPLLLNSMPPFANRAFVTPFDRSSVEYIELSRVWCKDGGLDEMTPETEAARDLSLCCHSTEVMVFPRDRGLLPLLSSFFSLLWALTRSVKACLEGSDVVLANHS